LAQQNRAMKVHHVITVNRNLEIAVVEANAGRQRVAQISLANRPARVAAPEQLRLVLARQVGVDAKAAGPRPRVVLLPDMREVDVADLVMVIEGNQQLAVADRDVTWHETSLSSRSR